MQIHPYQIAPEESFDVFYFIRNHLDSATYYIRARIYDVKEGTLLNTVDLEQSSANSRLYIKTVTAPPDPVGIGRNIVAISTVYTDSGYTTKSQTYEETEQYFLIKTSLSEVFGSGGGGVDYRLLREIFEEVSDNNTQKILDKPLDLPYMPFSELFEYLRDLDRAMRKIPTKNPEYKTELAELKTKQEALMSELNSMSEKQAQAKRDSVLVLREIGRAMAALEQIGKKSLSGINSRNKAVADGQQKVFQELQPKLLEVLKKAAGEIMQKPEFTVPLIRSVVQGEEQKPKAENQGIDISSLFRRRV